MKQITIGQYVRGDGVLHRMDARVKLILTVCLTVLLFLTASPASYAAFGVGLAALIALSGIRVRLFLRGLRPMLFIILFTAAVNLFFTGGDAVLELRVFTVTLCVTREGLCAAAVTFLRLVYLVVGTSVLTLTTKPLALTDGIEGVLAPLKVLRVPVSDVALMMSIAIRFIPTLAAELDKIRCAQLSRGADLYAKNPVKRVRAAVPLMIPLFVSAFRRADELAAAMDSRCYNGGAGRTRLHSLKVTALDARACAVFAVCAAAVLALR